MPLNEINPDKACKICGAEYDKKNEQFIVRCGNPISSYEFSGKVCFFARKRGLENECLNPLINNKPNWESFEGIDKKTEKVLKEVGVQGSDIDYLKSSGNNRY